MNTNGISISSAINKAASSGDMATISREFTGDYPAPLLH